MTLEPRARRLLDMMALAAPAAAEAMTIGARRESFEKLMEMGAKPLSIAHSRDIKAPGPGGPMNLRLYDNFPERQQAATALVFLHGGGLVAGSIETHDAICRGLALSSGSLIVSVGYRLAPEHRFPAALEDAAFAMEWVKHQSAALGIDPHRIGIGGESAGALLATLVANGHRPANLTLKAMLLLCPVIDLTGDYPSRRAFAKGFLIDAETVRRDIADCLAPGMSIDDLPSPLRFGKPELTPPTCVHSAECDPFRDEAAAYTDILERNGVPVWHICFPGMIHAFHGLGAFLPQAAPAIEEAGRQLKAMLEA